ncbi:TIM barrel protein [archaeon]|nr:TIM barrel protein [archaeon]
MKPTSLLFGPSGIPLCTPERNTLNGISQVKKLGLGSMELAFTHSINIKEELAAEVKKTAEKNEVVLTCHGQYFINLNAQEKAKLDASIKRVLDAARRAQQCGVWSLTFHAAYYLNQDKNKVYEKVKKSFKEILKVMKEEGINLWLRPETGGKQAQFGELNELIKLSQDFEQVLPCIDWAHHHARSGGKFNTKEEFEFILTEIEKGLGKEALQNMHCHCEGVEYSPTGEKNHVNLEQSDMNYKELVKVWKNFKIKGVITSESPNIEGDALLLKKLCENYKG